MTVGIYTSIGWSWSRVGGSHVAHLVPRTPGPRSRTACGRHSVVDMLLETPAGLLVDLERCGGCERRNGVVSGPARSGRIRGFGQ